MMEFSLLFQISILLIHMRDFKLLLILSERQQRRVLSSNNRCSHPRRVTLFICFVY